MQGDPECWGYNATTGGDGSPGRIVSDAEKEFRRQIKLGTKASDETKAKMSAAFKGRKLTPEWIEKIRLSGLGKHSFVHSEESIQKIRQAGLGRQHSEETKQKISEKLKNKNYVSTRPGSGVKKRIQCIETGEIFESLTEAAKAKNIKYKSSLTDYLKGRVKSAGGYHWKLIE